MTPKKSQLLNKPTQFKKNKNLIIDQNPSKIQNIKIGDEPLTTNRVQ